jgi:hypothetical protein
MADELDLHYERAQPLPPDQAVLSDVSEAHGFKHECVTAAEPRINPDGTIDIWMTLTFPQDTPEDQRFNVERWITLKLRQQIGLTQREIDKGFGRQVRFNRSIKVEYEEALSGTRAPPTEEASTVIKAEVVRLDLMNHSRTLSSVFAALAEAKTVFLSGRRDESSDQDIDGREDIIKAVESKAQADRYCTRTSRRLLINRGGAPSDVLEQWLTRVFPDEAQEAVTLDALPKNQDELRERLLEMLVSTLKKSADKQVLFLASAVDYLHPKELHWLATKALPNLASANPKCSFLFSVSEPSPDWPSSMISTIVPATTLDMKETEVYLGRYVDVDTAAEIAKPGADYYNCKWVAQRFEPGIRTKALT